MSNWFNFLPTSIYILISYSAIYLCLIYTRISYSLLKNYIFLPACEIHGFPGINVQHGSSMPILKKKKRKKKIQKIKEECAFLSQGHLMGWKVLSFKHLFLVFLYVCNIGKRKVIKSKFVMFWTLSVMSNWFINKL